MEPTPTPPKKMGRPFGTTRNRKTAAEYRQTPAAKACAKRKQEKQKINNIIKRFNEFSEESQKIIRERLAVK